MAGVSRRAGRGLFPGLPRRVRRHQYPFIGGVFFLAGLFAWYIPGIVFAWTPFFEFHEFGAAPTGIIGHLIMLAFYAAVAALISWPFREKGR